VPDSPSIAATRLIEIMEERYGAGLAAAAPIRAAGPRPHSEALRTAYLDVLKLCLCDLGGTTTTSVARTLDGVVMSRELRGEHLRWRAAGMDWPLQGLTMVGLARLNDLQACVESAVADAVPGDLVEAGSWRGGASLLMRATVDTLSGPPREVWVADSFQGFPAVEGEPGEGYDLARDLAGADFLAVPLEEVRQTFSRFGVLDGVTFVPGFFQDTLPALAGRSWSVIRLDGDTYDSVRTALEWLYPGLSPGGYVVVDDYGSLEECRAAVDEFRAKHGIVEPIEPIDWTGVRWRREQPAETATAHAPVAIAKAPQAVQRGPRTRVPAIEEVALREELDERRAELERSRERLASVESELRIARAEIARLEGRR
jgi:hypothetical protein